MMVAHIVCGSPSLWMPVDLTGYIVGVDRGALTLVEKNFDVDVAIGDFDSVSELERQLIGERAKLVLELPRDKDVTDCEAAIEHVVREGYHLIYLYGVTGARFDHQFAVVGLMLKYAKRGVQICVIDEKNRFYVQIPGDHALRKDTTKKYVSFFALENTVRNLTVQGVKYPLENYDLTVDNSLCVSNEPLQKDIDVSFDSGYLLVVQSSD